LQGTVSIDAASVAPFEFLGTPQNKPFIEALDNQGNFISGLITYYSGALPNTVGGVSPYETLIVSSATDNIASVIISTQQGAGGPDMFGLFDNLCFSTSTSSNSCGGETGGRFFDSFTQPLPNPNGGGAGVPEPAALSFFVPGLAVLAGLKLRSRLAARAL
ncbi:MAG TPA: hypothetical protein VKT49_25270, partial [Bryobacteraceae bacterium]|nr:hypothetical protein [Bryobacteraceae bacterium]